MGVQRRPPTRRRPTAPPPRWPPSGGAGAAGLLQGLGASVVDAPPEALAARLADAYLQVKAVGRL